MKKSVKLISPCYWIHYCTKVVLQIWLLSGMCCLISCAWGLGLLICLSFCAFLFLDVRISAHYTAEECAHLSSFSLTKSTTCYNILTFRKGTNTENHDQFGFHVML